MLTTEFPDFLATYHYHPLLLVGPLDCIQCLQRVCVCVCVCVHV